MSTNPTPSTPEQPSSIGMVIKRAPRGRRQHPPIAADRTLLSRVVLDQTLSNAKGIFAACCWINSAVTSIVTGVQVQQVVWIYNHPGLELDQSPAPWIGGVLAFVLQILLTFGQIYTAERSPAWYRACLLPDALATAFQWGYWVIYPVLIALASLVVAPTVALLLALGGTIVSAWLLGVYSARLPEKLVFGQRRAGV